MNQLQIIVKKHREKFQEESEIRSYEVFVAISNVLRKQGTPYQKLWAENNREIKADKDDMREFFKEVGVNVE